MEDLEILLDKAKWEKLTEEELNQVVERLENSEKEKPGDIYTLLHILGRSEAKTHKSLVEKFLIYPSEPMISRIALRTLCTYWNYTEDYLPYIQKFLEGVEWDERKDVLLEATIIAGEYLSENNNVELLKTLMEIFSNEDNDAIRGTAYSSIMYAVKASRDGLPNSVVEFTLNLDQYIDDTVINKANEIIAHYKK